MYIYTYTYIFSPNQMVIQNANYVWAFTMAWMTLNQDYIIIHPFGTSFLQPPIIPTNFTDKSIFRTNKRMGEIETIAMLFFWGGWGLAGDQKRDGSRMGAANWTNNTWPMDPNGEIWASNSIAWPFHPSDLVGGFYALNFIFPSCSGNVEM